MFDCRLYVYNIFARKKFCNSTYQDVVNNGYVLLQNFCFCILLEMALFIYNEYT